MVLMPTLTVCEQRDPIGVAQEDYRNRYVGMEFSYHQAYRYIGSLGEVVQPFGEHTFRKLAIDIWEESISVTIYQDEKDGTATDNVCVSLKFGDERAQFEAVLCGILGNYMNALFGVEGEAVDVTIKETPHLYELPDSMVLYSNGKGIKLSDAEKSQLYTIFTQMNAQCDGLPTVSGEQLKWIYTPADFYEYMSGTLCIEFRYKQRRSFSGTWAQNDVPREGNQTDDWSVTLEYDSIMLLLHMNCVQVVVLKDGLCDLSQSHATLDFGEGYPAFRDEVLSLMQ
jgi:hypothetical protein